MVSGIVSICELLVVQGYYGKNTNGIYVIYVSCFEMVIYFSFDKIAMGHQYLSHR